LREQFFELRGFGIVDVIDDIGKPFPGIDLVLFASAEEAVKHSDILSRFMITSKEVILAPKIMETIFEQVALLPLNPSI